MRLEIFLMIMLLVLYLCSCDFNYVFNYNNKNINSVASKIKIAYFESSAIITKIDYKHWYASAHHYTCDITVYNQEYDLEETFHLTGNDAKELENKEVDELIGVEMCIYIDENSHEITSIFINQIL